VSHAFVKRVRRELASIDQAIAILEARGDAKSQRDATALRKDRRAIELMLEAYTHTNFS